MNRPPKLVPGGVGESELKGSQTPREGEERGQSCRAGLAVDKMSKGNKGTICSEVSHPKGLGSAADGELGDL